MPAKRTSVLGDRPTVTAPLRVSGEPPPHGPQPSLSHHDIPPLPFVQASPVEVETNDTTRTELVKVIITWLVQQGFTSSAQLLREEATAQLRDEHSQRKSLRAICRCLDEQDWDGTQKNLQKLQNRVPGVRPSGGFQKEDITPLAALTRALPFLLAQQQFLELVDGEDNQRAFAFFMRSIKPFESTLSREHFQKLNYLLTCRTVGESAGTYPEFRGWSPEVGRSQLLQHIRKVEGNCLTEPYCRQGNITSLTQADGKAPLPIGNEGVPAPASLKSLQTMVAQSIAYEMLAREHPQLSRGRNPVMIRSLLTPLDVQLPPSEPLLHVDVNLIARELSLLPQSHDSGAYSLNRHAPASANGGDVASPSASPTTASGVGRKAAPLRLTACQPFLSAPAIAIGTQDGTILWLPLSDKYPNHTGGGALFPNAATLLRGTQCHSATPDSATTVVGSGASVIYSHTCAVKGLRRHGAKLLAWGGPQVLVFDLTPHLQSQGSAASSREALPPSSAPGYADGSPFSTAANVVADAAFEKQVTHIFTHGADVTSSCFFPCGTMVAAGLTDGTVKVWDTVSGSKLFENTFSQNPIVTVLVNHTGTTYYAGTKDGTICAVDVVTGMLVSTLAAPIAGELASLTLSPSSMLLLSSYRGGALRLWDVLLGKQLPYQFLGAEKSAKSSYPVTFGCQDDQVIAGSSDGCLYVWKLSNAASKTQQTDVSSLEPRSGTAGVPQRWSQGFLVKPTTQLPLHRASIADIKMDATYLVSCAADGMVYVCSSGLT